MTYKRHGGGEARRAAGERVFSPNVRHILRLVRLRLSRHFLREGVYRYYRNLSILGRLCSHGSISACRRSA